MADNDDDPLDIGSTIRQNAVKGFNAAKEYMDNRPPQAAPNLGAAASSTLENLGKGVNNMAEGVNFTTATAPPEGAPLLDRSRLLGGGDARLPAPHRVGDTGISYLGAVGDAVSRGASAVGDFYKNTPFVDTSGNSDPVPLAPGNSATPVGDFIDGIANYAGNEFATINKGYAEGAQAGASSTTADNIADQVRGTAKPDDPIKPVTEGLGVNAQDKAIDARVAAATDELTSIKEAAGFPKPTPPYGVEAALANAGFNPPDTAPTRLPSQGQAITNPLGGGQLNTTGGIVSASSARSTPGDAPYLGGGNAPLSRATGRATGDGSSNPNSPNFQPVGLGGVPIQSRDQWLAQRAAEKDALYQRRSASNRRDDARRAQESRQEQFDKVVGDLPRNLSDKDRAAAVAKLYDTYLGSSVKATGADKALAGSLNRDSATERVARARLGADANQDAISNQAARSAAAATGQKNSFDQEYKQARLSQYQAGINETASRNAVLRRKEEHTLGLDYARNARDRAAARRAELAGAADPNNINLSLASLGDQSYYQREQARINSMSQEELAEYRKNNPQTP